MLLIKDKNISFDEYIDNLILQIYKEILVDILGNICGYFDIKYQWNEIWLKLVKNVGKSSKKMI